MKIDKIKIRGIEQDIRYEAETTSENLVLKRVFLVGEATRGIMQDHTIEIKDNEIVELSFDDGTVWLSDSYSLDEIYPEIYGERLRTADQVFEIPLTLAVDDEERGFLGRIALKVVKIFAKKAINFGIEKLAAKLEDKQTGQKYGLFRIAHDLSLHEFVAEDSSKPFCLLIHGTASSISGSFGDLKDSLLMEYLSESYGNHLIAFQHRTLTENPLQNVCDLVKQLPNNSTLNLITTSRGGLVGELLSRFCNEDESRRGFTKTETAILKKEYPDDYYLALRHLTEEILGIIEAKKITIERFIRIACPAGGTTLASKRLNTVLNITFNLIGMGLGASTNPVYGAFKDLITQAIETKDNVDVLPGLEVQNPSSPFIKALNLVPDPTNPGSTVIINNSLAVIAGNTQLSFKLKALVVIASKLFFTRKNDLIVDTESMALGTRRTGKVQQYFFEGSNIDHFRYFLNSDISKAITLAFKTRWGDPLPGFTEEHLSLRTLTERNVLLKLESGHVFKDHVSGAKPIVVLLPGIMGSNLEYNGKTLWINYINFIVGGLKEMKNKNIKATSLVATSYKKLVNHLKEKYDVITFPFDWRLSLEESAALFNEKILQLLKHKQPIKIIGHSMGGVLVRDFMAMHPETWANLNESAGFRLVFMGAPLGGSFRIPAVLFGYDDIIKKLAAIDQVHSRKELVQIFLGFKGILGLLPEPDEKYDFTKTETWKDMQSGVNDPQWPLPTQANLQWFKDYREKVKNITAEDLKNAVYIAGRDKATACGYKINERGKYKELVFLSTAEGDYSVTWESGIPKSMIGNNNVYYVDVTHGSLANEPAMFAGISEILENGNTNLFSKIKPVVRGAEKVFPMPVYRDFDLSEYGIEKTLLGLGEKKTIEISRAPIRVTVSKGDLRYASYPVLAGHFEDDGILSAEKVINNHLNGMLSHKHTLGIYPGPIGTSEVFLSNQETFKGAIIIGLGIPGKITANELARSVEQGVANYLLHVRINSSNNPSPDKNTGYIGISTLMIGCGYGGLSIEDSIKAILLGIQNANLKIRNLKLEGCREIEHIEFVEIYEDKAVNCFYIISKIEKEENKTYSIIRESKGIKTLLGSKKRIPIDNTESWWNRITISQVRDGDIIKTLKFNVSTGSAREETKELPGTPALIEGIIEEMSTHKQWTPERAKTIFELIIPNDFKAYLKRHGNISLIVDSYSATYPWELLQDEIRNDVKDSKPICITSGMIRQLKTDKYRSSIKTVQKNNALIIADPDLKGFTSQLPGALKEGQEVAHLLEEQSMEITTSFKGNHSEIIEKLFSNDYKIIHLSGHGVFNEDVSKGSGMIIGKDLYLSTREIIQMSSTPDLVFVNCCHLGKTSGIAEELYQQRYKLAANIGTQLINNGVKCVVAAGWAVNDDAALEFARVFYKRMFEGFNFGDSIKEARRSVFEQFSYTNTWGAYQCYGDPFYKFDIQSYEQKSAEIEYMIVQEAEVDLDNLLNEIELGERTTQEYLEKLNQTIKAVENGNIRNIKVTKLEALIYRELKEYDKAVEKFENLMLMDSVTSSNSLAGVFLNTKTKLILENSKKYPDRKNEYLIELNKLSKDFETLISYSPTAEKINMLGSTYKRLAYLSEKEEKKASYLNAARQYRNSYIKTPKWYSLINWLSLESTFVRSKWHKWGSDKNDKNENIGYQLPTTNEAIQMLEAMKVKVASNKEHKSYWDMIAILNLDLTRYIIEFESSDRQAELDIIRQKIISHWKLAGSKGKRFAEVEHLDFLSDAIPGKQDKLKKELERLKASLEQLI